MRLQSRLIACVARCALGILGLAACDAGPPGGATASGSEAPEGWESLGERAGALRLYYQYVDSGGGVRFVERLEEVPESWRDKVGFVKLDVPPPLSPLDAERQRSARAARGVNGQIAAARAAAARGTLAAPARPTAREREPEASNTLVLYSADWCPICLRAKDYLDDRGIDYEERDVDEPEWKQELVAKTGRRAIPVFEFGGRILSGFRPEALERLIGR